MLAVPLRRRCNRRMGFRLGWRLGLALIVASAVARAAEAKWLKASTPNFTIITSVSQDDAARHVREFQEYVTSLRGFLGEPGTPLPPLTIVVFRHFRDFDPYRPRLENGKPQRVGGYFVRHESWAVIGVPSSLTEVEQRAIFHEGVHWFLSGSAQPMPPWLEEGMAEVFSTFRIEGSQVRWGAPIDDHVERLRQLGAWSLESLMNTPRDELFENTKHTGRFYAESWACVHFLMFGHTGIRPDALTRFRRLIGGGALPEAACAEAFDRTPEEIERLVQQYIESGSYYVSKRPLVPPAPVKIEPAAATEVDEALGRLALVAKRYDLALQHGQAIVARSPEDPRGHALVGVVLKERGTADAALASFDLAVKRGATDFQPYFELACAAQTAASDDGNDMSPTEARHIADLYEQAITRYPQFETTYDNLTSVVAYLGTATVADRATFIDGAKRYPNDLMIALGLAEVMRLSGDAAGAHAQLASVLARNQDPATDVGSFARELQTAWENEDFFNRVSTSVKAQRFEEALAALDAYPMTAADTAVRQQIQLLRPQIEAAVVAQRMNAAIDHQEWTEARRLIGQIVASNAPSAIKTKARRALEDIDRQQLLAKP